ARLSRTPAAISDRADRWAAAAASPRWPAPVAATWTTRFRSRQFQFSQFRFSQFQAAAFISCADFVARRARLRRLPPARPFRLPDECEACAGSVHAHMRKPVDDDNARHDQSDAGYRAGIGDLP